MKKKMKNLQGVEAVSSGKTKTFFSRVRYKRLARIYAKRSKKAVKITMKNLGKEIDETREMAKSFFHLLESKLQLSKRKEPPTKEEVKAAIEQLKDVGRISVFASISIIPGGGFSLIGLEILARKMGIKNFTFLPSAFRKQEKDQTLPDPQKGELRTEI